MLLLDGQALGGQDGKEGLLFSGCCTSASLSIDGIYQVVLQASAFWRCCQPALSRIVLMGNA